MRLEKPAAVSTFVFSVAITAGLACTVDPDFLPNLDDDPEGGAKVDGGDATVGDGDTLADGSTPDDGETKPDAAPKGTLFAFVGSTDGKIRVYTVDAGGGLTLKKENNAGKNPSFIAFDPPTHRVVSVDEGNPGIVRSFLFDTPTGALTEVNNKTSSGDGATHLSIDPSGKWVFVANYTGGNMSVLPLAQNGTLGDTADKKTSGAKSHWAGTNPSGTHVFVPSLDGNVVSQYILNNATGKLTDNGTGVFPAGAGPRHLAFHPSEKYAYVVNELGTSVTPFTFDKTTGKLSPLATVSALPSGQSSTGVTGAEIFVHPNGKFVYASTRVYNSIALFSIDGTGQVSLLSNTPTGGNRPRSFGLTPEGNFLFAANQDVNEIVGFTLNEATGALTSNGKITVNAPEFVGLVRFE